MLRCAQHLWDQHKFIAPWGGEGITHVPFILLTGIIEGERSESMPLVIQHTPQEETS